MTLRAYLMMTAVGLMAAGCSEDATITGATAGPGAGPGGSGGAPTTSSVGGDGGGGAPTTSSNGGNGGSGGGFPGLSFFVTSVGQGVDGGNYGGLRGADEKCEDLADAVGAGAATWRAYLSTSAEDARDRIGSGPWMNVDGVVVATDVDALHDSGIASEQILDENGELVPASGPENEHDIVTGSDSNGQAVDQYTCNDWTTSQADLYTMVGHSDWSTDGEDDSDNWNSVHETGCDQAGMMLTASSGRIYCFAAD